MQTSPPPGWHIRLGRWLSHTQARSAPNSGTVALIIDVMPVVRDSNAKEIAAVEMLALRTPVTNASFQYGIRAPASPRKNRSGSRASVSIAARSIAVGRAPNSTTARRMKRKLESQRAGQLILTIY
jgi:hypothetical protein